MATTDQLKAFQARVARLQQALDALLGGDKRSTLEASTGAGSNRVGYFRPDVGELRAELGRARSDLSRLQGDRSAIRGAFYL